MTPGRFLPPPLGSQSARSPPRRRRTGRRHPGTDRSPHRRKDPNADSPIPVTSPARAARGVPGWPARHVIGSLSNPLQQGPTPRKACGSSPVSGIGETTGSGAQPMSSNMERWTAYSLRMLRPHPLPFGVQGLRRLDDISLAERSPSLQHRSALPARSAPPADLAPASDRPLETKIIAALSANDAGR